MTSLDDYRDNRILTPVTIEGGNTDSDTVLWKGNTILGLYIPASFDGTDLQIMEVDPDTGLKIVVKDVVGATQLELTNIVAPSFVFLQPLITAGVKKIILVADSQTGDSIITIVTSPL